MGRTDTKTQDDCESLRLLPSCRCCRLFGVLLLGERLQGRVQGTRSLLLQLRWTLPVQRDLLWERSLPRPLRPVWVGSTLSSLRRLDLPLRGGGGGPTRGGNAQLLSRSRPRWEREWKVTGVCSHSSAGSTRWETRITRLLLLT